MRVPCSGLEFVRQVLRISHRYLTICNVRVKMANTGFDKGGKDWDDELAHLEHEPAVQFTVGHVVEVSRRIWEHEIVK